MGIQGDAVRRNYMDPMNMGPKPNSSRSPGINKFNDLYNMYYNQLSELCANRFKWTGLPPSVDIRFLEQTLFRSALSVFYFDTRYDRYFALRASSAGSWNMYDNPTHFMVSGSSFISRYVNADQSVPIWANYTRTPDLDIVSVYANKFAELDMTLEINTKSARRTRVVFVSENQRLSVANIMKQIDDGEPVVAVNKKVFEAGINDMLSNVDLGMDPDMLLKTHMYKTRLWGECMGLLGIDNANQDKKERLVASEVSANDGQTENFRRINLNARQQAAQAINRMYPHAGCWEGHMTAEGTLKCGTGIGVGYWVDDVPAQEPRDMGELSSQTERAITRG